MRRVNVTSRLDEIARQARHGADNAAAGAAHRIAREMRARVPADTGATARSIKVERNASDEYAVTADFPWRQLEFGTVKMPARPFATPAAEAERDRFNRAIRNLFQ